MRTYFTYSPFVKGVTFLTALLLLGAIVTICFLQEESWLWQGLLVLFLGSVLIVPVLYAPWYYERRAEGLYIRRLAFGRLYRYADYELSEEQGVVPIGALRLWGSGGYCGFLGLFYSPSRGRFTLIITDPGRPCYQLRHRKTGRIILVSK